MNRLLIFLVLLFAVSCSSPDSPAGDAGSNPDSAHTDRDADRDADRDDGDAASTPAPDAAMGDASSDAAPAIDLGGADATSLDVGSDAHETDTGSDMGASEDPFAGRPVGQCTANADCPVGPQGQECSEALPGGACVGCGSDVDCPGTTECQFGTCIETCATNDDCAPGLRCLGSGRCGATPCQNDVCPVALFGCSESGNCARVDCSTDPTVCPDLTTCTGGWCIEDRAL